ncbi:MAG: ATP-dependent Clp protease adaptor ClpS [Anaerolineae bacterium]|nr:ATP-dependent Clp protease adaptor ClpS [Phycisphaerae bacterium]
MAHEESVESPTPVTPPGGNTAVATETKKAEKPAPQTQNQTQKKSQTLPPYNVILLDDDDHTYDYVVMMLRRVFGHPEPRGFQLARQVDSQGRAIVMTTHRELAELKRDQVLAFGADPRIASCVGSMSAVIEPAESN